MRRYRLRCQFAVFEFVCNPYSVHDLTRVVTLLEYSSMGFMFLKGRYLLKDLRADDNAAGSSVKN
jgi:hypothetical protein